MLLYESYVPIWFTIIPGATYSWDFGTDAIPAGATGYGPHTVYYTSEGTKTVTLIIYPNAQGAHVRTALLFSLWLLVVLRI
jgi:hypothetical protein